MKDWIKVSDELPPKNLTVRTLKMGKDDNLMITDLYFYAGRWFDPNPPNMYMYWSPTHWKLI